MGEFLAIVNAALPLVSIIGTVLFGCAMWYLSRSFVTRAEHAAMQARLGGMECKADDIERLVTVISSRLDALPGTDSWQQMQTSIEGLRGTNAVLLAKIEGQNELLKRIEHPMQLLLEYQLKGGK